jgi:branched-chain amino acid transport system substrate-binding protein
LSDINDWSFRMTRVSQIGRKFAINSVAAGIMLMGTSAAFAQAAPAKGAAAAASATAGQTVKIAFIDPLSGPFANIGQNQLKSWQFVAERFSGAKNAAGVKFEVTGFDAQGRH